MVRRLGRPSPYVVWIAIETVVAAATATAFIGRKNIWLDEAYSVAAARRSMPHIVHLVVHDRANVGAMGPYYLLLHLWMHVGHSEGVLRLLSVPAAVATVPLVAVWARRLFDEGTAVVAGGLAAVNVMLVQYAQEARAYSMLLFASAAAVVLFTSCVQRPRRGLAIAWMVTCAVAFYLHYFVALVVVALLASLWLLPAARRPRMLWWAAAGFVLLTIPMIWVATHLHATTSVASAQGFSVLDPGRLLYHFTGSVVMALVALAALVVAAIGTGRAVVDRDRRWPELLPWLVLVVPAGLTLAASLVHPAWRERYLIVSLPAFLVLVARGVMIVVSRRMPVGAVAIAAVGVACVLALVQYYRPTTKSGADWRDATAYTLASAQSGGGVWFEPSTGFVPFDYYVWRDHATMPRTMALANDPLHDGIHPRTRPVSTVGSAAASLPQVCVVLLAPTDASAHAWTARHLAATKHVLGPGFRPASSRAFGPLLRVTCFRRG